MPSKWCLRECLSTCAIPRIIVFRSHSCSSFRPFVTSTSGSPVPRIAGWVWFRLGVTLAVAYLIVANGLLFFAGAVQIALLLGVSAALLSNHTNGAVVTAALVGAVMTIVSPPRLVFDQGGAGVLLQITLLSAAAAYGVRELRDRWPSHDAWIVRACVAGLIIMLLANFWLPLVVSGIHPLVGYGPLPAARLRPEPVAGAYITDDELYRRFFYLLHQGQGHYEAFRDAWLGLRIRGELPASVTSYRLPTYYWVWRSLPADAFLIVPVFLLMVSLGGIAAGSIAATLGGAAWAPLATAAVLTYGMGVAISVYVTYVDLPAASIALCGIAVLLHARRRQAPAWVWTGVALLTLAALTREILAYLLGVGAVSALVSSLYASRSTSTPMSLASRAAAPLRTVRPWLAGLLVFAIGYAVHAWQVMERIPGRTGHLNYRQGGVAFSLSAISLFGDVFSGTDLLLALLVITGLVGIWRATRSVSPGAGPGESRLFLLLAVLSPLVAMLVVGNPGLNLQGGLVNYWGQLFVPIALACWPLAFGGERVAGGR